MVVLTDCLTEKVDEGCLKVANNIAQKLKKTKYDIKLISYGRKSSETDVYLKLNKLFINKSLFKELRKTQGNIIYIPFASNTIASILRAYVLTLFSGKKVYVLFALRHSMNKMSKMLLVYAKFNLIVLSKKSLDFYRKYAKENVIYLKTGVNINKFYPVSNNEKKRLKIKYGLDEDKPVVLHVGHLHGGRNVETLADISEDKQVLLIVSSVSIQDNSIKEMLLKKKNIHIIDEYIPNIEEAYQLSDVYIFPVEKEENCIDVPLSVLEAAACGLPIVTTKYGELNEFVGDKGFYFMESINPIVLNEKIDIALMEKYNPRKSVQIYDWDQSINLLVRSIEGEYNE